MAETAKKVIFNALVDDVVTQLMVRTNAENVMIDENTTLAQKLNEILVDSVSEEYVKEAIDAAIDALIDDAPETYDTLREIAEYIEQHEEVVDALNKAIGDKADKTEVEALQTALEAIQTSVESMETTVDDLGDLATKDLVTEDDLDAALKAKIHTHDNKEVLDSITEEDIENWNGKGAIYVSDTQPSNLTGNDLWIQTLDDD